MEIRHGFRASLRVKPLALSLAIAFAGATAGTASALPKHQIRAIPDGMSPAVTRPAADEAAIRNHLQRMAAHVPPAVPLNSIPVTNCDDSGAGSLRDAVNSAADGDTIDMTGLSCSTITLTSGAISIGLDNLTVQGPGILSLTIDGSYNDRVFWHIGSGTLTINDVTVEHGHKYLNDGDLGNPGGACVLTAGTLSFNDSWAKYCDTGSNDTTTAVHGGAIYAAAGALVYDSIVSSSSATSTAFDARGGGIYTPGSLIVMDSTITGNAVTASSRGVGGGIQVGSYYGTSGGQASIKYSTLSGNQSSLWGGGAYFSGDAHVANSTVSDNQSCSGGGLYFFAGTTPNTANMYSSTISGNTATCQGEGAGVQVDGEDLTVMDSTIALNNALNGNATKYGAGLHTFRNYNLVLQNTIVATNMTQLNGTDLEPDDIGGASTTTVSGGQNLVYFPDLVMPGGTILLTDPMLRALAGNGGPTATQMLNFGSPAIDAGNNVSGATVDQRGTGYARIIGPFPDIGAVEFTLADEIFADGFD